MSHDPRSDAEKQMHRALAEATLRNTNARILKLLDESEGSPACKIEGFDPDAARQASSNPALIELSGQLEWGALLGGIVNLYPDGYPPMFKGGYGGLGVGVGSTWGTCFFNLDFHALLGQDSRFELNVAVVATQINLWKMDGTFIGHFIGGGVSYGLGVFGGQGTWMDHFPRDRPDA